MVDPSDFKPMDWKAKQVWARVEIFQGIPDDDSGQEVILTPPEKVAALASALFEAVRDMQDEFLEDEEETDEDEPDTDTYGLGGNSDD